MDSTGNSTGCRRIRRAVGAFGNRGRGYLEDFAHLRSTFERCSNFSKLFVAIRRPHFLAICRSFLFPWENISPTLHLTTVPNSQFGPTKLNSAALLYPCVVCHFLWPLRSSLKQGHRPSNERNRHFDCSSCQKWPLQGRPQMDSLC